MSQTTSEPVAEPVTGNEGFVEVYSTATGVKQMVPRHFVGDPVLGRGIRLTPSQRELDGDLGPRPTQSSTVKDIDKFAGKAGIDLASDATKDDKLVAIEAVFGHADVQGGLVPVEPDPPVFDPLAPALVAQGDPTDVPGVAVTGAADTPDPGDTASPDETPAAGDEEN